MRDVAWVLFAVGMPVVLYAFMCSVYAGGSLRLGRHPFEYAFASGMAVYGAGVTAFVNVPEAVAQARDRRLLKRLRGTPLTSLEYLVGRVVSALWIAVVTGLLVYAVGIAFFDLRIAGEGVPLAIAIVLLGTMTMAACGFALAAVLPNARATAVGALVILLPLSFFSDIFVFGTTPPLMSTIGSLFPLKHVVAALSVSLDPAGISVAWGDLAVVVVWLALATAVAVRRFRWEPAR
jgi:ABC-type multidrug transport system permease subunit